MHFRRATVVDLPAIVRMLADDELGSQRENDQQPLQESYLRAFEQINRDPNYQLLVVEQEGEVIGTLQLIFLPSISSQGGLRAQVEAVRVDKRFQNQKIGSQLMEHAIQIAKARGAHVMQLTTHNTRKDAHRFYERLGFKSSHVGMKLKLK
jgi:GNAT superfamily N-acetyltransferase